MIPWSFALSPTPYRLPFELASSDTICWLRQVSAKDEICHRGGQLRQGDIEKLDIQPRVVADAGAPGDNGVLHAVGDIADPGFCRLHQVNQLVSVGLEILLSVAISGLLWQPIPQLPHARLQSFLAQNGCLVVSWLDDADFHPEEVKLSPDAIREGFHAKLGDTVTATDDSHSATRAGHVDDPAPGFLDHWQHIQGDINQPHQVYVDHFHKVFLGQPFVGTTGQAHSGIVHQGPEARTSLSSCLGSSALRRRRASPHIVPRASYTEDIVG